MMNKHDEKNVAAIYVINVDEYFRAKPSNCDWDRLQLVSPSWAAHGVCEGWHDIFAEGRPLFARATQIEKGEKAILKPFQKQESFIEQQHINSDEVLNNDNLNISGDSIENNLEVILLLVFMVAGIYFMKNLKAIFRNLRMKKLMFQCCFYPSKHWATVLL